MLPTVPGRRLVSDSGTFLDVSTYEQGRRLCACGCGTPTPIAKQSDAIWGHVNGAGKRFVHNHHRNTSPVPYIVDPDTGCWVWQRFKTNLGYARNGGGEAYRRYYEQHVGPIPAEHHLHHRCKNPSCVNPDHLEPLTPSDHSRLHHAEGDHA